MAAASREEEIEQRELTERERFIKLVEEEHPKYHKTAPEPSERNYLMN
jgi:hypothetical protein